MNNSIFEHIADIDLTIVIVSFNTRELLLDCLESVQKNTIGLVNEIFVVDNASTDGSAEAVAKWFPEVHIIRNRENVGLSSAANQAFRKSHGRYFVLLNSETPFFWKTAFLRSSSSSTNMVSIPYSARRSLTNLTSPVPCACGRTSQKTPCLRFSGSIIPLMNLQK